MTLGTVTLLLCPEGDGCEAERRWLATVQPGLIVVIDARSATDAFVATNGDEVFAHEVESAEYAVQDKKWKAALDHLDAAESALAAWPGTVENHRLVRMYVLRGVALRHRGSPGAEAAFRQGASMAWTGEPDPRGIDLTDQLALDTERRKLVTSGTGTLEVPGSVRWWVDGVPVERRTLQLPIGAHRLTAVEPGKLRTFAAVVPVLPGRTVTVSPRWAPTDESDWLIAELQRGVSSHDADPEALALVSAWCQRNGVPSLALAEVIGARVGELAPAPTMAMSAPDASRPPAAAGEVLSAEDAIPATYEAGVAARAEAAAEVAPPRDEWRVRLVYFDAASRRLSSEPAPIRTLGTEDQRRFRLGARVGWFRLAEHDHATIDVTAAWSLGEGFGVRGEAGLAVADSEYRFYDDWQDNKLLHASAALTWTTGADVAPLLTVGAEVDAPLWAGVFAEAGLNAVFDTVWVFELSGRGGAGVLNATPALSVGAGASLSRRW